MSIDNRDLLKCPEDELVDIMVELYSDLGTFCKALFPERFRLPFTKSHYQAFEVLDDRSIQYVLLNCHRGWGKTSVITIGMMAREILFKNSRFIPYVSKSSTFAEIQTENLKRSLLSNRACKRLFGSIKTKHFDDFDEQFSKKSWVASLPDDPSLPEDHSMSGYKTLILPRGAGQQVRGLLFENYRPDFIQIDDLEDDKHINSKEQRDALKEWYHGPLMECISQAEEDGIVPRIVHTDTIKHEDALVCDLLNSSRWTSLQFPVCDDNYKTLVPGFISTEKIAEKVENYRSLGQLDVFAREYMCQPISKEGAAFKQDMFKHYRESEKTFLDRKHELINVVIIDPAKTVNTESCETGVVCWGVDKGANKIYLRYAAGIKERPDRIYSHAFEIADKFGAFIIGVESSGLGEFVMQPIRNEAFKRGKAYTIIELKAKRGTGEFAGILGGKTARVASLIPYYNQGSIYHNIEYAADMEMQLLMFPKAKRWDIMDAGAYIVYIMEQYQQYFYSEDSVDIYETIDEYADMIDTHIGENLVAQSFV